jgi:hypothetical protein
MSRAEAFLPGEHFDAVRSYRGTVTAEAIGEALGLSPEEARRVIGAMQAVDPNSPFILTRGRPPKLDSLGNVTREGTEAGRVIRRPPRPLKANETMLEYVTRTGGGLNDVGGDLKAMGGDAFHRAAPFRRKLIDNEHGQSLDEAFQRAIDAGYFPEHLAGADHYRDLPDPAHFLEAIDEELRGRPRHAIGEAVDAAEAARRARFGEAPEEAAQGEPFDPAPLLERVGANFEPILDAAARRGVHLDDEIVLDASDLIDGGMDPDDALDHAMLASLYRNMEEAAAATGNGTYVISPEERFIEYGLPEQRGSEPGDRQGEPGGGGPGGTGEAQAEARARLAQSEDDPAAAARAFGDPAGVAAEGQADSFIHDLEMQGRPNDGEPAPEPDGTTYRLDEEGGESDLASILDEIEQAQKAAATMRDCLKPKGGGK